MPIFWLFLTFLLYLLARWLQRKTGWLLLHPVLLPVAAIIALLLAGVPSVEEYRQGSRPLVWLLSPAVVALGVKLHEQSQALRQHLRPVLLAVATGAFTGVVTGLGIAWLSGAEETVVRTLAARSVTTPVGMAIAGANGGLPPLAAGVSISVGILGAVFGYSLLKLFKVKHPLARGLAIGRSSHGIGTARAMEQNPLEGTFSGLAFGLAGLFTAALVPLVLWVIGI